MRTAFIEQLTELAKEDRAVYLITGDLGFGVLNDYACSFPAQFLNAGVAEQNMTGLAVGLALEGRTVFTYSIGNFPTLRCLEQIRNDACYHRANIKIVSIGGGFSYGALGFSHHATEDLSILRSLPELTVVAPGDAWEVKEATKALAAMSGVGFLRLDKSKAELVEKPVEPFVLGKARKIREGKDMTLVASGGILAVAVEAAARLAASGIQIRVLSMHTIKPIDAEALFAAARETGGIATLEENTVDGGLGGAVAEVCLEGGMAPRCFYRFGIRKGFTDVIGSQEYMREVHGLNADAVVMKVTELVSEYRPGR